MNRIQPTQALLYGLGGMVALLLLANISIWRQGWEVYGRYQQQQPKLERLQHWEPLYQQQEVQLRRLNQVVASSQGPRQDLRDPIAFLNYLEMAAQEEEVKLIVLPQETRSTVSGYRLAEARCKVQGSLAHILNLLYRLEQVERAGVITYLQLERETYRQRSQRKAYLSAEFRIKRIITP